MAPQSRLPAQENSTIPTMENSISTYSTFATGMFKKVNLLVSSLIDDKRLAVSNLK